MRTSMRCLIVTAAVHFAAATYVVCPAGYYCPDSSGLPVACPPGLFCEANSQYPTGLCNAGFFCPERSVSATGVPSGGLCKAGTYCPPASGRELLCQPGTYSNDTARALPCTPCPVGRYSAVSGATSLDVCRFCEAGKTTAEPAATSRLACVGEEFSCPAGTQPLRQPPSALKDCGPLNCDAGLVLSRSKSSCQGCPAGYTGVTGSCVRCNATAGEHCPGLVSARLPGGNRFISVVAAARKSGSGATAASLFAAMAKPSGSSRRLLDSWSSGGGDDDAMQPAGSRFGSGLGSFSFSGSGGSSSSSRNIELALGRQLAAAVASPTNAACAALLSSANAILDEASGSKSDSSSSSSSSSSDGGAANTQTVSTAADGGAAFDMKLAAAGVGGVAGFFVLVILIISCIGLRARPDFNDAQELEIRRLVEEGKLIKDGSPKLIKDGSPSADGKATGEKSTAIVPVAAADSGSGSEGAITAAAGIPLPKKKSKAKMSKRDAAAGTSTPAAGGTGVDAGLQASPGASADPSAVDTIIVPTKSRAGVTAGAADSNPAMRRLAITDGDHESAGAAGALVTSPVASASTAVVIAPSASAGKGPRQAAGEQAGLCSCCTLRTCCGPFVACAHGVFSARTYRSILTTADRFSMLHAIPEGKGPVKKYTPLGASRPVPCLVARSGLHRHHLQHLLPAALPVQLSLVLSLCFPLRFPLCLPLCSPRLTPHRTCRSILATPL